MTLLLLCLWTQEVEWSGYLKHFTIQSESVFFEQDYTLHLQRFRQSFRFKSEKTNVFAWLDTTRHSGTVFETLEGVLLRLQSSGNFDDENYDWTANLQNQRKEVTNLSLSRLFIQHQLANTKIELGRQHINWGTGFFWNPTDQFHPTPLTSLERDEKPSLDGLSVQSRFSGSIQQLQWVLARKDRFAVKLRGHFGQTDWSILAGSMNQETLIGADFATYVGGAGLRGEFAFLNQEEPYFGAVLNMDYSFPNGWYGMLEMYYQEGTTQQSPITFSQAKPGHTYSAMSLSKQIHPLVGYQTFAALNWNDHSWMFQNALLWNALESTDLQLGVFLFEKDKQTEFGQAQNQYYVSIQTYF